MARKILLADDSVTAQNMGRKILVDAGYDVLTVNNGSAALKRINETKPDLIVLDVYMPGYSGLEVCQRLKDCPVTAHIPVLLSVGKLEPFRPQEAQRVKADAHIVKPFEASELLSAIARLEDHMVPHPDAPRFDTTVSGVERFGRDEDSADAEMNADPDTGWKSRLRFPSTKSKEEPEAEPSDVVANFRNFRKGKGKPAAEVSSAVASFPASWVPLAQEAISPAAEKSDPAAEAAQVNAQETGANLGHVQDVDPVPDVPHDITPEELDALSAVAAKLGETTMEADSIPSTAEKSDPAAEAAQVDAQETGANLGHLHTVDPVLLKTEEAVLTPAVEMQAAEEVKEVEAPSVEATESAALAGDEFEIPVAHFEPASEVAAAEQPAQVEVSQVEFQQGQSQLSEFQLTEFHLTREAPASEAENTAPLAQEPAPVDQQDEPVFASAPAEETTAAQPSEESTAIETCPSFQVATTIGETAEAEAPVPSDDELAEALRLLTPATAHAETAMQSPGTPLAMASASQVSAQQTGANLGHELDEEAAGDASAGMRWMAEAVTLTPEEEAMLLEAEMFRTFAAAPAEESEPAPLVDNVSTISAAVENMLAQADLTVEEAAKQVEPAQVEPSLDEAPKARAAAAAAVSSAAASASEENDIASIVDKVLADLRPKIVEEIAKKLGKK